jgi:hypothetical protein
MSETGREQKTGLGLRMGRVSPAGVALREVAGGAGKACSDGVDVTLRLTDFSMVSMRDPHTGAEQSGVANTLVNFSALRFRELVTDGHPADVWEFRVASPDDGRHALLFIAGKDILTIRVMSRVL